MTRGKVRYALLLWAMATGASAQTQVDLRTQSRNVNFSTAASVKPMPVGTSLPAACTQGEMYFKADAPAGANLYGCIALNTWVPQAGVPGSSLPEMTGLSGALLTNDGSDPAWQPLDGDVTGAVSTLSVQGIQGRPVSASAPSYGDVLRWNSGSGQWEPGAVSAATSFTDLNDLRAIRVADNEVSILPGSGVRFGDRICPPFAEARARVANGTGRLLIYVAPDCTLTVGHDVVMQSVTGAAEVQALTAFPADALPLWTWLVSQGNVAPGGQDQRSVLSATILRGGNNISLVKAGGQTTVAVAGIQDGAALLCSDTASTDNYTCAMTPSPAVLTKGMVIHLIPKTGNSGAATLALQGLAAAPIRHAADDDTLADGELTANGLTPLWYDGASWRIMSTPAGGASVSDHFIKGPLSGGSPGLLGWSAPGGSTTTTASVAGRPGIARRDTGAAPSTAAALYAGDPAAGLIAAGDEFRIKWVLRVNQIGSDYTVRAGVSCDGTEPSGAAQPSSGIYFEKTPAVPEWYTVTRSGGSEERLPSGRAVTTNFVSLGIRTLPGSAAFSIDGTSVTAHSNGIPSASCVPWMVIVNATAEARSVDVDYFELRWPRVSY